MRRTAPTPRIITAAMPPASASSCDQEENGSVLTEAKLKLSQVPSTSCKATLKVWPASWSERMSSLFLPSSRHRLGSQDHQG